MVTLHPAPAIHAAAEAYYQPLGRRLSDVLGDCSSADLELMETMVGRLQEAMDAYQ